MKKLFFGVLIAMLLAPFTLLADTPIFISKPMILAFDSTADVIIPKSGGSFQVGFTMQEGWQDEYRNAEGLRSFIQQELSEDELFWLSVSNIILPSDANEGRITFQFKANNDSRERLMEIHSSKNFILIRQLN